MSAYEAAPLAHLGNAIAGKVYGGEAMVRCPPAIFRDKSARVV
ncbi:hypothetical protein [Aquidulcibacter sp.]|nr:hypothetical protein [Aquidulcibacter sp.]